MGNVGGGNGTHSHEISHMNVVMDWWLITLGSLFNSTSRGLCVCCYRRTTRYETSMNRMDIYIYNNQYML